jgi:hypothetical protein
VNLSLALRILSIEAFGANGTAMGPQILVYGINQYGVAPLFEREGVRMTAYGTAHGEHSGLNAQRSGCIYHTNNQHPSFRLLRASDLAACRLDRPGQPWIIRNGRNLEESNQTGMACPRSGGGVWKTG